MILIADSGSTKTNWAVSRGKTTETLIETPGINPYFRSSDDILKELKKDLKPRISGEIEQVFFYGAGIVNEEKGQAVKSALLVLFPGAKVRVESDLLAAAHATCGNKPGIACILGTGSNSCLYDGEKITGHVSPLGYILGDEGSGAVMGRKLIGDYLKNIMPDCMRKKFARKYPFEPAEFLEKVYKQPRPNMFLAGFTMFLFENIKSEYCSRFLENEFELFIERNVVNYPGYEQYPLNFVGSIAYYFQEILINVLTKRNLSCGVILKDPMKGLVKFHSKTE